MKFRIADATGRMAINQQQISENFTLAKFLAIILVSTGHYFEGSLLWVPVTVGLFIFAFASGYFTAIKHTQRLPLKRFWIAKFKRLGPPIIVINLFLLALFLLQGREGIWHPHTLLGITGLSGFLNWLDIKSQSPFGAGLWFLTVLLLFYLVYPLLAKALTPHLREYHIFNIERNCLHAGPCLCFPALHALANRLWLLPRHRCRTPRLAPQLKKVNCFRDCSNPRCHHPECTWDQAVQRRGHRGHIHRQCRLPIKFSTERTGKPLRHAQRQHPGNLFDPRLLICPSSGTTGLDRLFNFNDNSIDCQHKPEFYGAKTFPTLRRCQPQSDCEIAP